MESLNEKIKRLEKTVKQLEAQVKKFSEKLEGNKPLPYSKVKKQIQFGNMNLIFDDIAGIWKTYAIYKDDE